MTCNFIKEETLAQVFSCEFYTISKDTLFTEYLRTNAFQEHNFIGEVVTMAFIHHA